MRLLFDQNLSHRLKDSLKDLFPESLHARDVGLGSSEDLEVWEYAKANSLTITSKDSDFRQLSFTYGHPLKVIWLRRANYTTSQIASILRNSYTDLLAFDEDTQGSFLTLN